MALPSYVSANKEVPKIKEGSAKSLIGKGQNGTIKDKKKEKKKIIIAKKKKIKLLHYLILIF